MIANGKNRKSCSPKTAAHRARLAADQLAEVEDARPFPRLRLKVKQFGTKSLVF
jgi:hypothetical protein